MSIDIEKTPGTPEPTALMPLQSAGNLLEYRPTPDISPPPSRPIGEAAVAQFVRRSNLTRDDVGLFVTLAEIARDGGSKYVMTGLGLAANDPKRLRQLSEAAGRAPHDQEGDRRLIWRSLRASLETRRRELELRVDATVRARELLMGYPRYMELLDDNNRAVRAAREVRSEWEKAGKAHDAANAHRALQYYAIGRIAGMIASYEPPATVQ